MLTYFKFILTSLISPKIFTILFLILIAGCSGSKRYFDYSTKKNDISINLENQIRVLLDDNIAELSYNVKQPILLYEADKKIAIINKGNILKASTHGEGVKVVVRNKEYTSIYFQVKPAEDNANPISYKKRQVRGTLSIINLNGKIAVINNLNLEEYLKGVLPVEMGVKGKREYLECLKAFAITARTYAVERINKSKPYFDVYADVRDQVYAGAHVETLLDNEAVESTKGLVLTYDNQIATVFYHSTCGGVTEDVQNVFTPKSIPYLISQKCDDNNCKISPSFNWTETYSSGKILSLLKQKGAIEDESAAIISFEATERFPSGRIKLLKIVLSDESQIFIPHKEIRQTFKRAENNGILRSTNFQISNQRSGRNIVHITLTGKGNGHGVGMCQWGAIALSKNGSNLNQILSLYFPSTIIKNLYD